MPSKTTLEKRNRYHIYKHRLYGIHDGPRKNFLMMEVLIQSCSSLVFTPRVPTNWTELILWLIVCQTHVVPSCPDCLNYFTQRCWVVTDSSCSVRVCIHVINFRVERPFSKTSFPSPSFFLSWIFSISSLDNQSDSLHVQYTQAFQFLHHIYMAQL